MKVSQSVIAVLANLVFDGNQATITAALDRKLYVATNEVLEAAGGKWNRSKKAHIFEGSAEDAIEQVVATGEITTHKDLDFFPTPEVIVRRMVAMANMPAGWKVLEPEAGTGNIAKIVSETHHVDCIEINEAYAKKIPLNDNIRNVIVGDFMQTTPRAAYNAVIMNPPFSRRQDIHHVNHAFKFLKDGGVLVAVMSAGVTFRDDVLTRSFRWRVRASGGEIVALEDGSFKESGTMVRAVIVVLNGGQS